MMTAERELLQRIVDFADTYLEIDMEFIPTIKELLAQPEQEPFAVVANNSVGFDVSRSPQGMPLVWLGKLEYGDKLYRVRARDE
jgi:hypothetical protein